jgi:UDP-glucose 4-epimerase
VKALVTGGAGFIGSHLTDALIARGDHVVVVDDLSTGRRENLESALAGGAELRVANVCDQRAISRIVSRERPDVIFHLAAQVDVGDSILAPARDLSVNVEGTVNVLEAARLAGVRRVVLASTGGAIYGRAATIPTPDAARARPLSPYGQGKYAAEGYCRLYDDSHGVSTVCLRFANVYGPRQHSGGEGGVVAIFCSRRLSGAVTTVYGDGLQTRDFVFVADAVQAALDAADGDVSGSLNIGTGVETSVLDLVAELGIDDQDVVHLPARAGEVRRSCLDPSLAAERMGWAAGTPLSGGLQTTLESMGTEVASAPERVLILSAMVGEGHEAAARALTKDLVAEGVEVVKEDGLAAMGFLLRSTLESGYRIQLRVAPWSYTAVYYLIARVSPLRAVARLILSLLGRRSLLKLIRSHDPTVIVSTHPAVTSVLGGLRTQGRVCVPTLATVTDLADHPLWAHPGVDLHLVMAEQSIIPVERVGGCGSARVIQPLVDAQFRAPYTRAEARQGLGLSADGPVVVVSGGGWGIGDVEGAARVALAIEGATVICVTGHNDVLRRQLENALSDEPRVRILGFTDAMSDLLAAADALVHSTGGMTFLEALTRGCPVVAYGETAGHIARNSQIMVALDLGQWAKTGPELDIALRRVFDGSVRAPVVDQAPGAAACVRTVRRRVRPRAPWRAAMQHAAIAVACVTVLTGWMFASDDAYALLAKRLEAEPARSIPTRRESVALVIRARPESAPGIARALASRGTHASFAFTKPPAAGVLSKLAESGSTAMPELAAGGTVGWLETGDRVHKVAAGLGLAGRHFYFLAPDHGLSLGEYMLARKTGARPLGAGATLDAHGLRGRIQRGAVVVVDLESVASDDSAVLERLESALDERGLAGTSPSALG